MPGDAFKEIPKLTGEFDFVFLDAWKRDYKRFFDLVFPRLRPRGLFLAHNVVNKQSEMRDFLGAIQTQPGGDDDDRPAVGRRHVGDGETAITVAASISSAFRSTSAAAAAASTWGRRRCASPDCASG